LVAEAGTTSSAFCIQFFLTPFCLVKINKKVRIQLLTMTKPYFQTEYGKAFLGDSSELMREIPDDSMNLVVTSPPFALTRKKAYGNKEDHEYVEWFMPFAKEIKRILKEDGSFVLDLGGAYQKGTPTRSLYQYELLIKLCNEGGFHLAQELFHYNPTRLPTPAEWVTVRRVRLKDSVNVVWWLSKSPNPKSDNRKVLLAYSAAMEDLLKRQSYNSGKRPSEHDINATSFLTNNGGAIAPNVLALANSESNSGYIRRCKENGLQLHPARFPVAFAEFFIRFLTDEGDVVLDPFGGSGATAEAAERMGRNWMTIEIDEEYIRGSKMRFVEDSQPLLLKEESVRYGKKNRNLKTA
jgi:site-specific DNA-methyltransferase (cytosine-N4-specific)